MDVDIERDLNKRHAAPTEFWVGLALLAITTLIALLLLTRDEMKDQIDHVRKTSYIKETPGIKNDFYGKEKI